MKACVITIGNEILCGDIINKDLAITAKILKDYGIKIIKAITVRDIIEEIVYEIRGVKGCEFIIVTGGLGPTDDDVTRPAIAKFLNTQLTFNEELMQKILVKIRTWNIPDNPLHKKYGFIPEGCTAIENPAGLAPGIVCNYNDSTRLIILPGPPRELKPTLKNAMSFSNINPVKNNIVKVYRTIGTRETELQEIIKGIGHLNGIAIGYYPSIYGVKLKITYPDEQTMKKLEPVIKDRIGKDMYSDQNEDLEMVIGKILKKKNLTISTAESCTGGLVGDLITRVSGSSAYFWGGIIAYANEIKLKLLDCNRKDLDEYGAVSEQIAIQMAYGVKKHTGSDIGISTTGIAGPTGATEQKPVGLVYIGYVDDKKTHVIKKIFKGNREEIKMQSALWAIEHARRMLL